MSRIVIISSGSPATNPRLVKEANALHGAGHDVHVLYSHVVGWADVVDEKILQTAKWSAELVGGSPARQRLAFITSSWWFKCVRRVTWRPFRRKRLTRTSLLLARRAKRHKADIYIAHNLGALAAAVIAAKDHGAKAAFDAEDYHHGEFHPNSAPARITRFVEDAWIPQCSECWSASPLIAEAYQTRYPRLAFHVIDNVFPLNLQQPFKADQEDVVRLIWFSQTIGAGRGLEALFEALHSCPNPNWQLTLIGRLDAGFETQLMALQTAFPDAVKVMPPMDESALFEEMAQHHIGLALETSFPLNRDLCRTNKLFSFILSGCHLLLTDTRAQLDFLETHPQCGTLLPLETPREWADMIGSMLEDPQRLNEQRLNNWTLGRDLLNWEVEQHKLLSIVSDLLNPPSHQSV